MASEVQQLQLVPRTPLCSRLRSHPAFGMAEEHHGGPEGVLRSHRQLLLVQSLPASVGGIEVIL